MHTHPGLLATSCHYLLLVLTTTTTPYYYCLLLLQVLQLLPTTTTRGARGDAPGRREVRGPVRQESCRGTRAGRQDFEGERRRCASIDILNRYTDFDFSTVNFSLDSAARKHIKSMPDKRERERKRCRRPTEVRSQCDSYADAAKTPATACVARTVAWSSAC